jgi:hypothetical protein
MQNGTNERQAAAREGLRTALVTLAKAARAQEPVHDAASASASGPKGPEAGEPASGQDPSEFREAPAPRLDTAALPEGEEEGGRGTPSGQSTPSGQ